MDNAKIWLEKSCPRIWSMLNNQAKIILPNGLREFIDTGSKNEIENGQNIFLIVEKYLDILISKSSKKTVSDAYRRDFSNVSKEKELSELFSEIAVCTTISRIACTINLRPFSKKPKRSDFSAIIGKSEIYGEIKRFEDKTKIISRSILSDNNYKSKQKTTRPRFLELESKLKDVHKQLPEDTVNILFLFHPSIGETISYVKQVLFGESNFWNKNIVLEPKSFFSKHELKNISAVCLCKLGENGFVEFYEIFINPNAKNTLPSLVIDKIKKCA